MVNCTLGFLALGELTQNRSYQDYLELLKINEICFDCIKLCLYSLSFAYRMIDPFPKEKIFEFLDEISKLKKKKYFYTPDEKLSSLMRVRKTHENRWLNQIKSILMPPC